MCREIEITVGELAKMLESYPSDTRVVFGRTLVTSSLFFHNLKMHGDNLLQVHLCERFPIAGVYAVKVNSDNTYDVKRPGDRTPIRIRGLER